MNAESSQQVDASRLLALDAVRACGAGRESAAMTTTAAASQPYEALSRCGIDLYWLPLGAGGRSVRLNGRVFEWLSARCTHRTPLDLYHAALDLHVPEGRYVIEMTPVPKTANDRHGVVAGRDGVVRASFVGPPTATDLWAAVAEARYPGSSPEPDVGRGAPG